MHLEELHRKAGELLSTFLRFSNNQVLLEGKGNQVAWQMAIDEPQGRKAWREERLRDLSLQEQRRLSTLVGFALLQDLRDVSSSRHDCYPS